MTANRQVSHQASEASEAFDFFAKFYIARAVPSAEQKSKDPPPHCIAICSTISSHIHI